MRIVIDTNVLVGSAYNAESASRRILEACLRRELVPVVTPAVLREYRHILPRAARHGSAGLEELLSLAEVVEPETTPRVVRDDPADDKLLAAAAAGRAAALVTSDQQVLALDPYQGIRILRPGDFERWWRRGTEAR